MALEHGNRPKNRLFRLLSSINWHTARIGWSKVESHHQYHTNCTGYTQVYLKEVWKHNNGETRTYTTVR